MNIIHLTASFLPNRGGVENHVAAVMALQQQAGHTVTILTKPRPHTKLATWKFIWQHRMELLQADVIQVHDIFWWLLPVYPLIWLKRIKIITTFHGWEGQFPIRWQAQIQRWWYNQLSYKAVHVGAWIEEFYWDTPDAITYGGIDSKLLAASPFKKTGTSHEQKLHLVFIGRLEAENDMELYIKLIEDLNQYVHLDIHWVGDGRYKKICQKYGQVTGMVEDISPYIAKADLVLASSYLSILQAQAMGKLVVALYSHQLKQRYLETYPGAAWMMLGDDIVTMIRQLEPLLMRPAQKQRLEHQAMHFARTQTWQKVADMYMALL
jgi:glycosyltransferase involved in cell wall biosynthesis